MACLHICSCIVRLKAGMRATRAYSFGLTNNARMDAAGDVTCQREASEKNVPPDHLEGSG